MPEAQQPEAQDRWAFRDVLEAFEAMAMAPAQLEVWLFQFGVQRAPITVGATLPSELKKKYF